MALKLLPKKKTSQEIIPREVSLFSDQLFQNYPCE